MKRIAVIIGFITIVLASSLAVAQAIIENPVKPDNPLLLLPPEARKKLALSPHIGGITAGSFYRYFKIVWKNMMRVSEGQRPVNIVNGL